jgi:hypothetical protein
MKITLIRSAALLFLASIFTLTVSAQRVKGNGKLIEKTRQVGNFESLGVSGSFDVFLVRGNEGKIELGVEENLEPYLITEVENGKLKIKWKKGSNINTTKKTTVTVYFEEVSGVALAGSGDIISRDAIASDKMDVAVAGSGDIRLELKVNSTHAAVSGSGDIELSGTSTEFDAAVAGSGDIDASELQSQKADLKISGSGTIHASVANEIVARISGSGDIKYKGNPKVEDIKVSGSGKVSTF